MRKLFKDIQRFIYLNRILSSHIKFVSTISKISNDDKFSLDVKQQILQNSVNISNQLLSLYESIKNNYKH